MKATRIPQLLATLNSSLFKDVPDRLMDNLSQLCELTQQIEDFAHLYDYGDLKFNGCRTLLEMTDRFVPIVKEYLLSSNIPVEPLIEMTSLLVKLCSMVVALHTNKLKPPTSTSTSWHLHNFISSKSHLHDNLKCYWGYFSLFYIESNVRYALRLYALFVGLVSGFPGSLSTLISRNSHGSRMVNLLYQANAFFPLTMLNCVNNPFTSVLSTLHSIYHRTLIKKLSIPRQTDWIIPKSGGGRVTFCPDVTPVRSNNFGTCRLMSYTDCQPSGDLIFHVRGGAFVVDVPQFSDTYLMEWVPQLNGAVIMDVDYTRCVRYPVALQEILDAYLWVTSKSEQVTKTLGFTPRKIIFSGDSGGAYLLFTLSAVLRDIQKISPNSVWIFPTSLVSFYPILSFNHEGKIPSLILGFMDAFLNLNTVYQGMSLYASGITFDSDCEPCSSYDEPSDEGSVSSESKRNLNYDQDKNNNNTPNRYSKDSLWERFYNTWFNSDKNWYNCDKNAFTQRSSKILTDSMAPYISPMVCYDINSLDDLSIYLITGQFDPFLDMALEYAKIWKGKVKVDIIPDLPHGFLNMTTISDKANQGANVCLSRLIEALQE
ncbi:uncharacterized protein LOC107362816 [Tetranychus urticae]|uniref:uncharacterized protein LOC107362816 n=1 Tax=Tetranychus urticae TaxID=32264 RepID=UPI00077BBB1F|nr:uncharacterized protein LOC107362816 [Tetranychus urticae]XP_015785446.1 uncharacterized protein LOC107362816 [Tetranychus urticae]XP_015785454.1 uncharacterized protein LOC107362816 [Tetranychus urticae]